MDYICWDRFLPPQLWEEDFIEAGGDLEELAEEAAERELDCILEERAVRRDRAAADGHAGSSTEGEVQ
jgi:hypothetical protein